MLGLMFPLLYLATPYVVLLEEEEMKLTALALIMLLKAFSVIVGFPCLTILLTNSATSLRILGTLNGFATTFSGIGRAIGPAATGATFTWGVENGYIIAPWWLLAAMALIGAVPTWFIVEGDGPSRSDLTNDTDDSAEESESMHDSELDDDDESDEGRRLGDSGVVIRGGSRKATNIDGIEVDTSDPLIQKWSSDANYKTIA
jgi:hypothetical protein